MRESGEILSASLSNKINVNINIIMYERKPTYANVVYIFIEAVGDALHVSDVFAHHQERQKTKPIA
jgi:hypothetical protein